MEQQGTSRGGNLILLSIVLKLLTRDEGRLLCFMENMSATIPHEHKSNKQVCKTRLNLMRKTRRLLKHVVRLNISTHGLIYMQFKHDNNLQALTECRLISQKASKQQVDTKL